jgi:hypothetical protein
MIRLQKVSAGDSRNTVRPMLLVTTGAVMTVLVVLVSSHHAPASPTITWTPTAVTQTIPAGASTTVAVSFVASASANNVVVRVVPELQPLVSVTPAQFTGISKGQRVTLTLSIAAPPTAVPSNYQGTIQLRSGNVLAQPLPVNITVVWSTFHNAAWGVQFQYPTFGRAAVVELAGNTGIDGGTVVDVRIQSPGSSIPVSQFGLLIAANTTRLSLEDWLAANVDPDGLLLSARTFAVEVLPDGRNALVHTGAIPDGYNGGPVAQAYTLSQSANTVIAITQSQINDLEALGVPHDAQTAWLVQVLATVTAP